MNIHPVAEPVAGKNSAVEIVNKKNLFTLAAASLAASQPWVPYSHGICGRCRPLFSTSFIAGGLAGLLAGWLLE